MIIFKWVFKVSLEEQADWPSWSEILHLPTWEKLEQYLEISSRWQCCPGQKEITVDFKSMTWQVLCALLVLPCTVAIYPMLPSCLFLFVGDFSLELKTLLLQAAIARDWDVAVLRGALTSVCSSPESHGEGRDPHQSGGERPGARALGKWLPFLLL